MKNEEKETIATQALGANPSLKEIVIREGKAKELLPEERTKPVINLEIKGLSQTCSNFILRRGKLYDPEKCHAKILQKDFGVSIKLILNEKQENDQHVDTVISEYKINAAIEKLKLNSDLGYKSHELAKLLRPYRMFSSDKDFFNDLISKLFNYKSKAEIESFNQNNRDGKMNVGITKNVIHDVPKLFTLNIPIFLEKKVSFSIEINYDAKDDLFYLFSDEFIEKLDQEIKESAKTEIEIIENYCFVAYVNNF